MKDSDLDIRRLAGLLLSRWPSIVVCVGVFLAGALAFLRLVAPIYSSTLVVQVEQATPNVLSIQEVNPEEYRTPDVLKTIEQALASKAILLRVIRLLKLDENPVFAPQDEGPWTDIALSEKLAGQLRIALRRGTRLIDIEAGDRSPERAKTLAETVVKVFIQEGIEQRVNVWKETNAALLREASQLKENLRQSEQALQDFKEQHQAVSLEDSQNIVIEKLRDLSFKLTSAKSERLRLEGDLAAVETCKTANPREMLTIASVAALPEIQLLIKQINEQEAQMATLKEQYLARSPRLISTETQLGELFRTRDRALWNAGNVLRQSYASAQATEAKLEAALRDQERMALDLNKLAIPVNALRREIESNRALYDALLKRLKETEITQGFDKSYLRVVDAPLLAEKPKWPRKGFVLGIALFCGLALGVGSVITSDLLSSTFKSAAHAEESLGLRVLTSISKGRGHGELITSPKARADVVESFRWLHTALHLTGDKQNTGRTVAFVGAQSGDGVTSCAANYALTLARQGRRVLLIDADLRRPRLKRLFQAKLGGSLAAVLAGELKLEQALAATDTPGLSLLAAEEPAANAAELLANGRLPAILQEALTQFDNVVLDTPPLSVVGDTLNLVPAVDSVCLVVSSRTPRAAAERVCQLLTLAQAKLAGIILHGLPQRDGLSLVHAC